MYKACRHIGGVLEAYRCIGVLQGMYRCNRGIQMYGVYRYMGEYTDVWGVYRCMGHTGIWGMY